MTAARGQAALPVPGRSKGNWKVGRAVLSAPGKRGNEISCGGLGQTALPAHGYSKEEIRR